MQLVKYNEPTNLANLLDDFFDTGFSCFNREVTPHTYPSVDIIEEKEYYKIKAELPGLEKKDIEVKVENGILSIRGEKKQEIERKEKEHYYYLERSYGKFNRSFNLPEYVDGENIKANYNNGLLEITLNKKEEAKPKAIEVKVE